MSGETGPIAEMANRVSKEVLKWFRWERIPLLDQNFDCVKSDKHAPTKKQKHTHPVDVVFKYHDPYLENPVLLNADLKSYKKGSIKGSNVRSALKSLAHTIDCARGSKEWRQRYDTDGTAEVRGLLFVYNHDAEYDRDFYKFFAPAIVGKGAERKKSHEAAKQANASDDGDDKSDRTIAIQSLPLESSQMIHILEPRTIAYMTTILADVHRLHADGAFPIANYAFFYPDLKLHKARGDKFKRPATIEMICAPFLIVEHEEVRKHNELTNTTDTTYEAGYVIYYNRPGRSHYEFMYLFDILSSYQILDGSKKLRLRVAHHAPDKDIRSHFLKAINMYVHDWDFDDYKKDVLEAIELELVDIQKSSFSQVELGWERAKK